jgi:hypothetical protein
VGRPSKTKITSWLWVELNFCFRKLLGLRPTGSYRQEREREREIAFRAGKFAQAVLNWVLLLIVMLHKTVAVLNRRLAEMLVMWIC